MIAGFERRTIDPIPQDARHGRARDLFTLWFGSLGALVVVAVVFVMYLGFVAESLVLAGQSLP